LREGGLRVSSLHTWDAAADAYEDAYKQLLPEPSVRLPAKPAPPRY
jgi:hypothetical protein